MDASEIYKGISAAVEAAKPAQEFCFFGINHWSTCMTKAEWSGWMQAIFSVIAIAAAFSIALAQHFIEMRKQSALALKFAFVTGMEVAPLVKPLLTRLNSVGTFFEKSKGRDFKIAQLIVVRDLLKDQQLPTEEQFLRLLGTSRQFSLHLIAGFSKVRQMQEYLGYHLEYPDQLTDEILDKIEENTLSEISDAHEYLNGGHAALISFINSAKIL